MHSLMLSGTYLNERQFVIRSFLEIRGSPRLESDQNHVKVAPKSLLKTDFHKVIL